MRTRSRVERIRSVMAIGCVGKANYVDKTKIVFIFKTMIALINATSTPTRGNPSVTYRQNSVNLIEDKSVLEWQIVSLVRYGIVEITVIVDAKETAIRDHLRDGSALQAKINYVSITDKDGVDKALHNIEKPNELIYIYGGVMLDLDWRRFIAYHKTSGASVSVLGTPTTKLFDCYCLNVDEHQIIRSIFKRERDDRSYCENLIVGDVFIITPALLSSSESLKEIDPAPEAEEAFAQERIEEVPAEVLPQDTNDSSADTSTNALPQSTSENGVTAPSNALNALGRGLTIFAAVLGVGAVITDFFTYPDTSVQLIVFGIVRLVFFILMVIPFKKEWLSIVSRVGALGLILWLFISLAVFIPSIPSTRIETSYGTEFLMNEALFWVTFGLAAGAIVFSAISLIMYLVAKHKENNNH